MYHPFESVCLFVCLIIGSDLPYCSLEDTAQCCTESHLLRMKANITEDLITGMQEDLHATTGLWMGAYSFSKGAFLYSTYYCNRKMSVVLSSQE